MEDIIADIQKMIEDKALAELADELDKKSDAITYSHEDVWK